MPESEKLSKNIKFRACLILLLVSVSCFCFSNHGNREEKLVCFRFSFCYSTKNVSQQYQKRFSTVPKLDKQKNLVSRFCFSFKARRHSGAVGPQTRQALGLGSGPVLKRKRRLVLRLTARVTDPAGNTRTVRKTVTGLLALGMALTLAACGSESAEETASAAIRPPTVS